MPYPTPLKTVQASSNNTDPAAAVSEISQKILGENPKSSIILFFCKASNNLDELGPLLKAAFEGRTVIGCTSCGQINETGFTDAQISAIGLSGDIAATSYAIDLRNIDNDIRTLAESIRQRFKETQAPPSFGILNIDGMSMKEEKVASTLYKELPPLPFVGGSAGDDKLFEQTKVYFDGKFSSNMAVFSIFETSYPFSTVKIEHFKPTSKTLVVTESDPEKRIITEINGENAAQTYAAMIGKTVEELNSNIFMENPLLFGLGNQQFSRDIQKANPDGSLSLFCAIETGLVLTIGEPNHMIETAQDSFGALTQKIGKPSLIIGFDCIHRKINFENHHLIREASQAYKSNNVFGFSTYGEQYNGIHINQTFTGIAIGESHE